MSMLTPQAQNFIACVGQTPLLKIGDRLYGKLETYNPTGSIKDRMISYIVRDAVLKGNIKPTTLLVEATSGNTGIALSALGAALGNPIHIVMPYNMSEERKQMMRSFGTEIIEVGHNDFDAAIKRRNDLLIHVSDSWSPNQFENKLNIECHFKTTAHEIHSQLPDGEKWDAFISGVGTGGTIMGIHRYVKENSLGTKVVMIKPAEDPELHGIQGIGDGEDFLADTSLFNQIYRVKTQDAKDRASRFAKDTGLLVGISAGANIVAAERWIEEKDPDGVVVVMLCDRGERYMS